MSSFPASVGAYLERISIMARFPAFLLIAPDGTILDRGGELALYGLDAASSPDNAGSAGVGQALPEPWRFLLDFLPLPQQEESMELPLVKVGTAGHVDLHILSDERGAWIIFLDASAQEARQRLVQQRTNELSLLEGRQQKLLRQYIGEGIAENLLKQLWDPGSEGERRVLTILFADIRGFTAYSEARPPGHVFQILNSYLRAMIDPITARGGWIDKLIGDQVMALFGLLPGQEAQTSHDPVADAVQAAQQIVRDVRALSDQKALGIELDVGIGITTGSVALGVLGTSERRSFSAIGHHVNVASRLESQARRGEIVIDSATYERLGEERARFQQQVMLLKGLATPFIAYVCGALPQQP